MKKRILGVDIGIASLGWAVIEKTAGEDSGEKQDGNILAAGVRLFTQAENPKNGEPLAKPRRDARLARRRNRRRAWRMEQIKKAFLKHGLIKENDLANLYVAPKGEEGLVSPWLLRAEALNKKLSGPELARALTHVAKRRGFKSLRLSEEKNDAKQGKLLEALEQTRQYMRDGNYETAGQMLALDPRYAGCKRNKREDYHNSIPRDLLEEEVGKIFSKQRALGNALSSPELENDYRGIAFFQRPIGSVLEKVGNCTFEKNEKRAPKQSYSAELFAVISKINNQLLLSARKGERTFTEEERKTAVLLCHELKTVSYAQLKKKLAIAEGWYFKGVDYSVQNAKKTTRESKRFAEMSGYHELKTAISKTLGERSWEAIKNNSVMLDTIAQGLAYEKSDEGVKKYLQDNNVPEDVIGAVSGLNMKKFIHVSCKALRKILPHMLAGQNYSDACALAGYDHSNPGGNGAKSRFLPKLTKEQNNELANPVVKRAATQFRKVLNAVIRQYGQVDQIHVELARDISHNFQDRREILKGQEEFRAEKERAKERCRENGINPDESNNLLKFRLWEQQGGFCLYSAEYIKPERLSDTGYCDIDHIIPYSRSLDDSLNNKILCLANENRQKGNLTPREYMLKQGGEERWDKFASFVHSTKTLRQAKKNLLLKMKFDEADAEKFKSRNLNDTRYVSRFIKNWVEASLEFPGPDTNKLRVQTRNGRLTDFLRHQWGITKDRSAGDLHHAADAIVTACATQGMAQYLSTVAKRRELWETKDKKRPVFKHPWEGFQNSVAKALSLVFVSRAPRHKVTGAAHKETARSVKHLKQGYSMVKTPLTSLTTKDLENLPGKETYNRGLYEALKKRLAEHSGKADKAFAEKFYFPSQDGRQGPLVRSVRLLEKQNTGVKIHGGKAIADNGEMVRVDVFRKNGKHYLVPIYVADMVKDTLPNKAIVQRKPESEWPEMDKTYEFMFSLFKDDIILTNKSSKKEDEIFGYYIGTHRGTGAINIENHDRSKIWEGIGAKTLKLFKKFQIDPLGRFDEIVKEKRLGTRKMQCRGAS